MTPLAYALAFLPGLVALVALALGGPWVWAVPAFIFGLVPAVELLWRGDDGDPDEALHRRRARAYDALVWAVLPLQLAILALLLVQVARGAFSGWELAGAIFTVGLCCGAYGLNVGHELGHRPGRENRLAALVLMGSSLYPHFLLEHTRGHHRRVATPEDPASAARGELLFPFWLRSIAGGLRSAWQLDRRHVLRVWGATLAGLVLVTALLGPAAAGAWILAGLVGVLLLETVNYVEHYGLRREKLASGRWERTRPCHSWNADHPLGRALLFDLTRHSDHHAHPGRRYQLLRSFEASPQLPTGYPGMILLALCPPAFFAVIHPHLDGELVRMREAGAA